MELQLESLFDGPAAAGSLPRSSCLGPVSQPLSFRHFTRDMLQVGPVLHAARGPRLALSRGCSCCRWSMPVQTQGERGAQSCTLG